MKDTPTLKKKTLRKVEDLAQHNLIGSHEITGLKAVAKKFSIAISPSMYASIDKKDLNDPIKKQFIPNNEELKRHPKELSDPIGDETHEVVKGIIHRYPDRCLLKPVNICAVYCRFCFRREKIGPKSESLGNEDLEVAFEYIRSHPEIWEVILSGGDPFILTPKKLASILKQLDLIKTVEVVRIHTRIPIVTPESINLAIVKTLKLKNKPIYIVLHANHPKEFTSEAKKAIAMLADAGIPLLGQSVLLKDINDDIETLSKLMRTFIQNRIKPYYLHHGDLALGTSHFRTSIIHGQNLMQQLQGTFSGLCQPHYVLDIPGGFGKTPIQHNYITTDENGFLLEDYQGRKHHYCDKLG